MRAYFKLFKQFIARALASSPLRAAVTALGISLGVGVMIAIRLANTSALESFRAATDAVAGETSIQITGASGRFDEMRLGELSWLRRYGQISPVITGYAMISGSNEFLQVLGVDVLRDRALRRYRLLSLGDDRRETTPREFLLLLTDPHSIILTEKLARRYGLSIGSPVSMVIGSSQRELVVRALLRDEGPARALDGNFALMDIAAAQASFDRLGLLDRLDVKLKDGIALEQAESDIADRLPEGLSLARPEAAYGQVEKMIAAFHFNLNALGSIALLVGLFLIYNTVSISVITRREEIGVLRAIGVGRRMVLALFLGEALLLALAGTLAGLGLGRLLAAAAVRATAATVETFYIASTARESISQYSLGQAEALLAFAVALPLSLIAAAIPALEAARVRPVEAMRGAERLARSIRPSGKHVLISLSLFAAGYMLSRIEAVGGLPVFGYLSGLALMFGGAFLVPGALWLVCRARPVNLLGVESRLASANLRSAIPRISISVAALAMSLAMMAAISIMIGSFRETVSYWVDQTLKADIYARPLALDGEVPGEAIAAIESDPNVAAVDAFVSQQISYGENQVTLGAGDFSVLLDHGSLLFKSPSDATERLRGAIGRDAVVVTESFSLRFDKQAGDTVELPTTSGLHPFEVAAVYYDYSSNRGRVVMDRATFARHFNRAGPASLSIYLKEGVSEQEVRESLAGALGGKFQVVFTTNASVRREVVRIFDSTFSITYALEIIAIVVAGLGVISTLLTLILERRGEIAVLGFLGATRAQVRRIIVIEAVMIGGVSQMVGIFIGLMLSLVLIYVINVQSFGWTIQFHLPWAFLIQSTALILVATAVAGLYPASRAASVDAVRIAREE
jgi:putative ABC transport system permease protein